MTHSAILFARAPSAPGKTRLTADLALDDAIALRRALLLDTYDAVRATGIDVIVAFEPDDAGDEVTALLDRYGTTFIPQRGRDLGARMHHAFVDAFAIGVQRLVLVGSDLPSLPSSHLTDAWGSLDTHDIVLGPSEDGGYYLVGLNRHAIAAARPLFDGITWGSDQVLAQTRAASAAAGLRTALIAPWFDVDTRADLARLGADPRPDAARHTREWLRAFSL